MLTMAGVKRIFLTGASSGIGRAIAERLTKEGHEVWGTSRDASRLPAWKGLHPVVLDLGDDESIATAFATAEREAGEFDVLINNAGSGHFGPAELMPRNELVSEFQVLVFGHVRLIQLALPRMRARSSGTIVNISSLASQLPVPFMSSYNSAKAAMAAFTLSLRVELGDSGVSVVDLQPADIHTEFNDAAMKFGLEAATYRKRAEQAWSVVDKNLRNAPGPELVARRISELIAMDNPPPRVIVGDLFQARIAPVLARFLPMRLQLWGVRKYYGI